MADLIEPVRVAALEERRLAVGVGEVTEVSEPWCGGTLCYGGKGSWSNQTLGACMDGQKATAADVAHMVEFYESRGVEPKIMTCPFADESLLHEVGEAGFRVKEFECVFAYALNRGSGIAGIGPPEGVEFQAVDVTDEAILDEFVDLLTEAFGMGEPSEDRKKTTRSMTKHPRIISIVARADGRAVGGASFEAAGEIASLCGAAVLPDYRRRGIQRAMFDSRLTLAREHGCAVVTVATLPGIATERNAMRAGFLPSYTRVALVRPGEGLEPSP